MKYDINLIKLIEEKNFKTFWHCLDYLLLAGYSSMDAFGISLKHFGENKIFSSVAFVRMQEYTSIPTPLSVVRDSPQLVVGLIDETNIHLDGLYTVYRKMLNSGLGNAENTYEIENTCEVIKLTELNIFILEYLIDVTVKHFGVKSFSIPEPRPSSARLHRIGDIADDMDRDLEVLRRAMQLHAIPTPIDPTQDMYNGWPPPAPDSKIINLKDRLQNQRNRQQ